jgi:hypothetical protein
MSFLRRLDEALSQYPLVDFRTVQQQYVDQELPEYAGLPRPLAFPFPVGTIFRGKKDWAKSPMGILFFALDPFAASEYGPATAFSTDISRTADFRDMSLIPVARESGSLDAFITGVEKFLIGLSKRGEYDSALLDMRNLEMGALELVVFSPSMVRPLGRLQEHTDPTSGNEYYTLH